MLILSLLASECCTCSRCRIDYWWNHRWSLSCRLQSSSFTGGFGAGATIALSYALLGGFAVAISQTGIPQLLVNGMLRIVKKDGEKDTYYALGKVLIILASSYHGGIFTKLNSDSYRIYSLTRSAYLYMF